MRIRAFLALPLSPAFQSQFSKLQNTIRPFLSRSGAKFVRPEVAHITLRFFESLEDSKVSHIQDLIYEAVNNLQSFRIKFSHIDGFPNLNHCKVLWQSISSGKDAAINLKKQIDQKLVSLGFPVEGDFVPHLTIARFRTASSIAQTIEQCRHSLEQIKLIEMIDSVCLYKSTLSSSGPLHEVLFKASLQTQN